MEGGVRLGWGGVVVVGGSLEVAGLIQAERVYGMITGI
jgi:hypothetical protein